MKATNPDRMKSFDVSTFYRKYAIYAIFILLFAVMAIASPRMFSRINLIELLNYSGVIALVALGQTIIIGGRGIDLSVGSNLVLTGCVAGYTNMVLGWHGIWSVLVALAVATFIGFLNGFIIVKTGVPDLIVTLAMLEMARGIAVIVFQDRVLRNFSPAFAFLGRTRIGWFPISLIVLLFFLVLVWLFLARTVWGRSILAVGGNRNSATLAGISYSKYKILSYMAGGFLVGVATLLLIGRLGVWQTSLAIGYELHSIAAVVIGGTFLFGGIANPLGTIVGVLFIAIIRNGLVLARVNHYWYMVILGVLMIVSVSITLIGRRDQISQ